MPVLKKWHSMTVDEVVHELKTDIKRGLSEDEVSNRLKLYGFNQFELKKRPTYMMFLNQFNNFLIIILLIATGISLLIGEKIEAIAIFIVVLIMGLMGFIQEYRAEKTIEALKKMITPMTKVIRDGDEKAVPSTFLVPGDVVVLKAGDIVPADMRLVEAIDLEIDESSFTGESTPVEKRADLVLDENIPVSDRLNMAFLGTSVLNGTGKGIVVATGNDTELGKIAETMAEVKEEKTPLEVELDYFAKKIGLVILGISAIVFLLAIYEGIQGFIEAFMTAIALAVAAIPEGLPAIATGILAIGAYKMAKKNALVRKLSSVETLGSINVICSDKTGTITKGEMTLKLVSFLNSLYDIDSFSLNTGDGDDGHIHNEDLKFLLEVMPAHIGKDAEIIEEAGRYTIRGSPTEGAVLAAIYRLKGKGWINLSSEKYPLVGYYPFDRFRKMKSTVHRIQEKYIAIVSGAPDILISYSTKALVDGKKIPLDDNTKEKLRNNVEELGNQGYRTLGLAFRILEEYNQDWKSEMIEKDLTYIATLGIVDPPREGVAEAIKLARKAGIKVMMVTGDHKSTAKSIARMIGLEVSDDSIIEGRELEKMKDTQLLEVVDKVTVFARVTPEHKLRIVRALKSKGYKVAMTGDGINDAPALKAADIGIAMGVKGTEVAKEASQMVLLDDNFSTIVEAVKEGRIIYENLKKPINFLLSCNLGEIGTIFGAELMRLPIPLTPLQLLWINVVTDVAPAVALGVESPEPDIMERPPRTSKDRLITLRKLSYYVLMGTTLGIGILLLYKYIMQEGLAMARTMAFTSLVVAEIGLVLAMRSESRHFWELPFNKWIIPALSAALFLQTLVIYTPLRSVFNTVALDLKHWLLALIVPFLVALVDALRKTLKIRL